MGKGSWIDQVGGMSSVPLDLAKSNGIAYIDTVDRGNGSVEMRVPFWKTKSLPALFLALCLLTASGNGEVSYPWKSVFIGALDSGAWIGLVLVPSSDSAFAFRLKVKRGEEYADGEDFYYLISEIGPHSPDGQYARLKVDLGLPLNEKDNTPILRKPSPRQDTLVFEWSRQDERIVIGKIESPQDVEVHMVHYFPWDSSGEYRMLSDGQITGESVSAVKHHYLVWTNRPGNINTQTQVKELIVPFSMTEDNALYFVAGVGDDPKILNDQIYRYKNSRLIDSVLLEEEDRYEKSRTRVSGLHEGVARSITSNLFWTLLYQPEKQRMYTPASRNRIFAAPNGRPDHWTLFGWISFLNALEISVESFELAEDVIRSVLETQYPNGNIPNWRGRSAGTPDRSQPPLGSYVVLKLFLKNANMGFLSDAYPYLKRWHEFWKAPLDSGQARRDGNGDGLLEWGADIGLASKNSPPGEADAEGELRAKWESGQFDLPNWDGVEFSEKSNTLVMNCLDLNCYYTLDAWCLSQIANILDIRKDYSEYLSEYEEMKQRVDEYFWNEREGFYFDRYWNGMFSTRKAATNFLPLLARIPDQNRALRLIRHLLNDQTFWGDYVIPTVSRNDPAFQGDLQLWRGTVSPPVNYLIFQGLKAYGFDTIASEFATKSAALFLRSWENFQLSPENFDSRTGEGGGNRHQSWGALFALIGLEEYLDITPWEGFRFGMIDPDRQGTLHRLSIQGRHYDVSVSRQKLRLLEEGEDILEADGGAVFRHFIYNENEVSFEVKSLEKRKIQINFLTRGTYQLLLDDEERETFKGKSVKIKIPEGEHSVLILLLEKED